MKNKTTNFTKTVVTAPESFAEHTPNACRIFLAGSIEMGSAIDWQSKLIEHIKSEDHLCDVVIFNPRRNNWDPTWEQSINNPPFAEQVDWEQENIERANIVVFFFQPGTMSPISLFELGLVSHDSYACKKNVIVLCPDGFYRKGNVDITAQRYDMWQVETMDELKKQIKISIKDFTSPSIDELFKQLSADDEK